MPFHAPTNDPKRIGTFVTQQKGQKIGLERAAVANVTDAIQGRPEDQVQPGP